MTIKYLFLFVALFAIHMNLSAQNEKGAVYFLGHSMQEQNDSLYISFDIRIKSKAVSSCSSMAIIPVLSAGHIDEYRVLPYILIRGNAKRQKSERNDVLRYYEYNYGYIESYAVIDVNEATDTLLNYRIQIPYDMGWMDSALLEINQEITGCRNESRMFAFTMDNTVKLQSREPFQPEPFVTFTEPLPESKNRKKQGQAFLDFQVGRSVIVPSYRKNPEELAKIREVLQEVTQNPDVQLKGLFIEGYASPDGKYNTNERLSAERANALKEYMVKTFGLDERLFKVNSIAEDWDGLAALVQGSDITKKEQILEIIAGTTGYDERENKLKRIDGGTTYRKMLKDMFPGLRRVEYQIDYSVKNYDLTEAKSLMGKKDDQLSQLEMYRIAGSYGMDSRQCEEIILERIPKYYPDDATAINNAMALLIQKGELTTAKRYLEKLDVQARNENNWGVILLLEGELDKAEALFKASAGAGNKEAVHNLEQTRLKREDNERQERYKK